ncbi:MAG: type IV pilus secretin PilQ [Proteobacteria bacterium]|nr:type IV pilus secretin PilQ [Pseudomonadota bacterium]MBU1585078.1 type IV pilus secretin PilQ [Pseudomonadota bacterium]MBU2456009.1 type IV pilus secretin PilQ [Pseudomonadota bacterium]MBU2629325.1 type IV pilus secretin PilQ [Pseudomonadota bacterium]
MPFFQMKKIKWSVKIIGFLLTVVIVTGCVAQKTEDVKTAEQTQNSAAVSDKSTVVLANRQISDISIEQQDQMIEIRIQGNQKLVYTSIKQSFPFGIAIYLPETQISEGLRTMIPENNSIGDLIVGYADKEKTTAKVEILLKEDLSYEVTANDNVLNVSLFGNTQKTQTSLTKDLEPQETANIAEKKLPAQPVMEETVVIPDKTATMTHIEFNTMEDGKSDIVVQTNHPVKYDITQADGGKLYLNLYNTIIPEYHKRPLLTQYFKSAVESLIPLQIPGKKKNSKIEIKIRDQVPYRIVQNQNIISLFFEPARIEPPVFSKAKKKVLSGTQVQTVEVQKQETGLPEEKTLVADNKKSMEEEIFGPQKKYTGEKIKLDFYETDIKNVFRILRSVGGLNFAIDKDVEGKVTLTLQDPVPWDQVMDLVLKMNNLGMKKEGNVIRIATLDTINKEEKLVQESIAAFKKSLEQKESFEPLITEYIPINYSDAEKDIKPHIDQILSKDRGKISVDNRTNMVIVTDTQSKIDQVKEIIYRLDKVTPQIMIEAKVVEVTKNFSRELGVGLSISKGQTTLTQSRDRDFSVALNSPIAAPVNTGAFNFYRILGSNLLSINAQLTASEAKGDVKVVSSPRILTLDNKKAKIKQGLEYAYLERDDTGGSSVKFKNIDLLLEVTPHVTPDSRISMNVYLTKNDIDSVTNGVPSLATNEAQTELLVNNNDTIIIGGIVKTTDNKSTSGTPFLSGIPILGRLFRTDTDTDNRNELLIFLTPSIVQLEQKRNTGTKTD